MTPLDEFAARWALTMPVPLVAVINTNVNTDAMPDRWAGALLASTIRRDVTMGSNPHVDEEGELIVALFARAGEGANALDDLVALLREKFHGYMTADNTLQFTAVVGPQEVDPMAEGEWWRLAFLVPFRVWSRRPEPLPAPGPILPRNMTSEAGDRFVTEDGDPFITET